MTLTPKQEEALLARVAEEIAEKTWAKIESEVSGLQLLSIPRLAGMLDLSTTRTRELLEETIEFGPRDRRVSIAEARRLVATRTVQR